MELNINRLKVLGEEELQRLDEKVLQHQASTETTILSKSIDEIKRKILDTNAIIGQLTRDLNSKGALLSKLQADLSASEKKYIKSEEDVDKLEKSIASLQAEIDLKQVKFSEMDENIIRLKQNERVLREQLADVDSKLTFRTEQFLKEQDEIQTQIKELEQKLKMRIQNSFTQHDEFVKQVKSIKLEPSIDDCQAIFDNIKMDLVLVLSRNIEKYVQLDTVWIKYDSCGNTGKTILKYDYIRNYHNSLCKGFTHTDAGAKCKSCSYIFITTNPGGNIKQHEINSFNWLKNNYKQILNKFITHKELKYIIEKLDYQQFNKLFVNCDLFYVPVTPCGFLEFVLFIGTNGEFVLNDLNKLN